MRTPQVENVILYFGKRKRATGTSNQPDSTPNSMLITQSTHHPHHHQLADCHCQRRFYQNANAPSNGDAVKGAVFKVERSYALMCVFNDQYGSASIEFRIARSAPHLKAGRALHMTYKVDNLLRSSRSVRIHRESSSSHKRIHKCNVLCII